MLGNSPGLMAFRLQCRNEAQRLRQYARYLQRAEMAGVPERESFSRALGDAWASEGRGAAFSAEIERCAMEMFEVEAEALENWMLAAVYLFFHEEKRLPPPLPDDEALLRKLMISQAVALRHFGRLDQPSLR